MQVYNRIGDRTHLVAGIMTITAGNLIEIIVSLVPGASLNTLVSTVMGMDTDHSIVKERIKVGTVKTRDMKSLKKTGTEIEIIRTKGKTRSRKIVWSSDACVLFI